MGGAIWEGAIPTNFPRGHIHGGLNTQASTYWAHKFYSFLTETVKWQYKDTKSHLLISNNKKIKRWEKKTDGSGTDEQVVID